MTLYAHFPTTKLWGFESFDVRCDSPIRKSMKLFNAESLPKGVAMLTLKVMQIALAALSYPFSPNFIVLSSLTSCVLFPSVGSVAITLALWCYIADPVRKAKLILLSNYFESMSALSQYYLDKLGSGNYNRVEFSDTPLIHTPKSTPKLAIPLIHWVNSAISSIYSIATSTIWS